MKVLFALAFVTASACTTEWVDHTKHAPGVDAGIGGAGGSGSGSGSGIGSGNGTGSGSGSGNGCVNQVTGTAVTSGHHNPGQDCQGGCHDHGFTLAGTLYDATKVTAIAGATIIAVDANGTTVDMISGTNGNFYTTTTVAYPVTVTASMCPNVTKMTSTVAAAGCNSTACHGAGAAQGPIHLP